MTGDHTRGKDKSEARFRAVGWTKGNTMSMSFISGGLLGFQLGSHTMNTLHWTAALMKHTNEKHCRSLTKMKMAEVATKDSANIPWLALAAQALSSESKPKGMHSVGDVSNPTSSFSRSQK